VQMRQWVTGAKKKAQAGVRFLEEAWMEMKRVRWPSPKETSAATLVVLVVVLIIAFFLGLIDFGLTRLIRLILG
jgi:preprotein translocase subunit SecE